MVTHVKDIVAPCPICGRRIKIRSEYAGQNAKCHRCHGQFFVPRGKRGNTVGNTRDSRLSRSLELQSSESSSPSTLPSCPGDTKTIQGDRVPHGTIRHPGKKDTLGVKRGTSPADAAERREEVPAVLLVEHRDEVYARLEADFVVSGLKVVRATTAFQAIALFARHKYDIVVANLDLLDQSGWLLTGKLHFIQASVCIWLYEPQKTPSDVSMANFLQVDELLEYGGDLLGLSDAILDCLAGKPVCQRRHLSGQKPPNKAMAVA